MSDSGTVLRDSEESHYAESFTARHFPTTVEIWCPVVDETKAVIGRKYVRHCPMCGEEVGADDV